MKRVLHLIALLFISIHFFAQAPQKMSYQFVARNNQNQLLQNTVIGIRISILQGSASGSEVYMEKHSAQTNENGTATIEVGAGSVLSGSFSSINWSTGVYFLKTEVDLNNGSNYSITGTSQLLSVPYALYASNGLSNGTVKNQLLYWNNNSWETLNPGSNGQTLTICDGVFTWTNGGICPSAVAVISSLNCTSPINNGNLIAGSSASGVSSAVPYTGGNGGNYATQTITSTGVTGLTATLIAGSLSNGSGNLIFTITGTPSTGGVASFFLSIGGQTCTLNRIVSSIPGATAEITTINCAGPTNNGTLIAGNEANGVNSLIPYTGGNGGNYATQTITSTGVTGLTATLTAGSLTNGSGNLNYIITGTPSSSGIASFLLSIGGQACTLNRIVASFPGNPNTVTDASGNTYPTVVIGSQVWMAENLRTTKYSDGSDIPVINDSVEWAYNWKNNTKAPMMCWYNSDQNTYTANKFGALYNFYTINPATNGNRNVCPTGWHVAGTDWTILINYLGANAGEQLKSTGTQFWLSPNAATNSTGFSALPGGGRSFEGPFFLLGLYGHWWSAFGGVQYMIHYESVVGAGGYDSNCAFSVRCVKD